ncbi:MAG: type II-A CRISPR-associated protein Csn2 [Pleomorphochaeta sp.]
MSTRLVNEPLNIYLDEIEEKYNILVIESKTLFYQVIKDLYQQINNEYGDFVFSKKDQPIEIKDSLELIINPFDLDINNKRILTAIQKLVIKESKNEIHYSETNKIITLLEGYAQKLAFTFDGNISPKYEITSEAIIKMINFQVDVFSSSFPETIFEYLINSNKYLNTQVFCFVNLFNYLENNQIDDFIKSCLDYHISVIFIEAGDTNYKNTNCKKTIIDSDFCQI